MRKFLAAIAIAMPLLLFAMIFLDLHANYYVCHQYGLSPIIDNMPLVDAPQAKPTGLAPNEQRGIEVRKWLMPGLKVSCSDCSGSGTIVYHDHNTNWAYVQSCGHLWDGNMSGKEGQQKSITCKVITWYHNMKKLSEARSYPAEVLFYSNTRGQDCSLLRFKPDWEPEFYPIGPEGYLVLQGERLSGTDFHSIGCDGGREIAHYEVEASGFNKSSWPDLITNYNSPRPGRSGGGLLSSDGYYVGICWGTSSYSGDGVGYFTPLKTIRYINENNGYGWLNEIISDDLARRIPIVDHNNPQMEYPRDYIPLPNGRI